VAISIRRAGFVPLRWTSCSLLWRRSRVGVVSGFWGFGGERVMSDPEDLENTQREGSANVQRWDRLRAGLCPNCGKKADHFAPPQGNRAGFYTCIEKYPSKRRR
jgi:hypothetical protein